MTNPTISVPVELLAELGMLAEFCAKYEHATASSFAAKLVPELRALLATPPAEPAVKDSLTVAEQPSGVQVPEGWYVRQVELDGDIGFIIGTPLVKGVRTNTSVWLCDDDPAHRLLATMLAAAVQPDQPAPPQSAEVLGKTCIDGGTCHHGCATRCFRRECCAPFSDYIGPWTYDDPAPSQPSGRVPEGYTPVLTETLEWMLGERGDFVCDPAERFRGEAPPYFWRRHLRKAMLAAPTPAQPQSPDVQQTSKSTDAELVERVIITLESAGWRNDDPRQSVLSVEAIVREEVMRWKDHASDATQKMLAAVRELRRRTRSPDATRTHIHTDNTETLANALAEVERLRGQVEVLRKDAERYRWLRMSNGGKQRRVFVDSPTTVELDAAIDAAIAAQRSDESL